MWGRVRCAFPLVFILRFEGGASWSSSWFHLQLTKLLTATFWALASVLSWSTSVAPLRIFISVSGPCWRCLGCGTWPVCALCSSHRPEVVSSQAALITSFLIPGVDKIRGTVHNVMRCYEDFIEVFGCKINFGHILGCKFYHVWLYSEVLLLFCPFHLYWMAAHY